MTSVREIIIDTFHEILQEEGLEISPIQDVTPLLDSGLDSLGFAVLVARLESSLGYDPFTLSEEAIYPKTFGEFISLYEKFSSGFKEF